MSRMITTGGEALRAERMRALRRRLDAQRRSTVSTWQRATSDPIDVPYLTFESDPGVWQATGVLVTIDSPQALGFIYFITNISAYYPGTDGRTRIVTDAGGHLEPDLEVTPEIMAVAVPKTAGLHTYSVEVDVDHYLGGSPRSHYIADPKLTAFVLS